MQTSATESYDVVVVGGGPAGATAAHDLALAGHSVLVLERGGRIKPCGGAIPPRLIEDFAIPDHLLVAKIAAARMVSPKSVGVDMPVENGFVGMVDREVFDPYLRDRASKAGAVVRVAKFTGLERDPDGRAVVAYTAGGQPGRVRATCVVGADGANSGVARAEVPGKAKLVFAYHEIVRAPQSTSPQDQSQGYDPARCDVVYRGSLSPDFYSWVFPHGDTASIGTGSARKGFSLRGSVARLRAATGLDGVETIRREGAPIPLKPLRRWDNGRDVILAGDAAGVVAPASGEGIYYAMYCGQLVAQSVDAFLGTGNARALRAPRRAFMRAHGRVFMVLGLMQWFWYASDKRREKFVAICRDRDVQRLTWDAYMHKRMPKRQRAAQFRVFVKDVGHMLGLARS
jgi:geranylgeranyl reductase